MSPSPYEVVVTEIGKTLAQRIQAGRHALLADEPVPSGGSDAGPDPYALLLSALGACTAMTLRMYADRKKWPLEGVTVRLSQQKIHARDCAECERDDGSRIDRITREIVLSGPLEDAQKQRLLEIADRCPIHRALMGKKEIVTRIVPS
ncbi:MAG: OsmC family protein [Acidobacteriota bacterium]